MEDKKDISIIIPTYNRVHMLSKVIDSYLACNYVNELIIIDDKSDEDYQKLSEIIKKKCKVRDIKYTYHRNENRKGAAGSRNVGVNYVRSDLIFWGEDDAVLDKDYLDTLRKKIYEKKYDIVAGRIIYVRDNETFDEAERRLDNDKSDVFNYKLFEGKYWIKLNGDIQLPCVHALCLCKKWIYEKYSYDENYKVNGYREETDLQVKAFINNASIVLTNDTKCFHLPRCLGGQWSKNIVLREFWTIRNNNYFINKYYDQLREKNPDKFSCSKVNMIFSFIFNELNKFNIRNVCKLIKVYKK